MNDVFPKDYSELWRTIFPGHFTGNMHKFEFYKG